MEDNMANTETDQQARTDQQAKTNQQASTDQQPATDQQIAVAKDSRPAQAAAETVSDAPTFVPPTDIYETKEAFIMLLDMPGANPDSLEVTLDKRVLTISARSAPSAPQGYTLMHTEFGDGNYERAFRVSDEIDGDAINAEFKDGVLRLTAPKTSPSPPKKIAVKAE
jgi:HSP20 family protein